MPPAAVPVGSAMTFKAKQSEPNAIGFANLFHTCFTTDFESFFMAVACGSSYFSPRGFSG